ncbi:MAG TPA: histidine kinase, partial [Candidatus Limnocylindria bacterium]|nr:histidine kinase [Candidatus Limnocylindria bacterium]
MSPRAATFFAAGVIAFAAVTTLVGVASGAPLDFLIADAVTGMTFVVAGYAAGRLRPASPAGPMLLACGALWYVGSYSPSRQPVVLYIGFAFERYYDLVLGALLLILSSRAQRPEPRWLIIGFGAAFAFRSFGRLFMFDLPTLGCADCPANPFAFLADPSAWETVEIIGSYVIALFAVAVGAVVVVRLVTAGPVLKRARGWILAAGILAMGAATFDAFEYGYTTANQTQALFQLEGLADWLFSWGLFGARVLVPLAILVAIFRMRAAPGPLGGFAAGLDEPGGSTAGDALRRALGDPSLVLLRAAADGGWVDEDGAAAVLPEPAEPRSVTLVGDAAQPVAALVHDPALLDQPELLAAVSRVLRLALENERLQSELEEQLRLVTESRTRIVSATEEERRRLERDLHDGAQQRLVAVMLELQQARESVADAGNAAAGERLDAAAAELNDAIRELRELARGIHPAILEEEGLGAAVTGLARRAGLPVTVHAALDARLPAVVESTAYFTIAEALTNAQRHANASQAEIHMSHADGHLEVRITDDGAGGADPSRGSGLRGLA